MTNHHLPTDVVCKQALTAEETALALAEFALRKRGMDVKMLDKAGVSVDVDIVGYMDQRCLHRRTEKDAVHLVTVKFT